MAIYGKFQTLRPLSLLAHLCSSYDSACLKVTSNTVSWLIYVEQGKIIYASQSVDPLDRLDCYLRRFSYHTATLNSEIRTKLRLMFDEESTLHPEYQAICWLVDNQYLNQAQVAALIEYVVKEVIESFLLIKEGTYEINENSSSLPSELCHLELQDIVKHCQKKIQAWQSLAPHIWSPYQRPYLCHQPGTKEQLSPEVQHKLSTILKGFSIRHLAVLLNQDELQLARSLYPYIKLGNIILQDPQPPFEQLPRTYESPAESQAVIQQAQTPTATVDSTSSVASIKNQSRDDDKNTASLTKLTPNPQPVVNRRPTQPIEKFVVSQSKSIEKSATPLGKNINPQANKHKFKIVCIDDSQAMLQELKHLLDDESFDVFTINDPVKALMQIVRIKPDLILLDVRMAGIDGYELCRLLRNHFLFKNTPIIMVTGNTGIIDRVKARVVGASGYLTKPFTQSELFKIIFRHLS
ncbi:response regulator [Gloeocapsopsis dulcis]|uniref:Two-component system response regulator n=1 Tax=Gloeocapsopsis dulcis AAB1 = 1H9 TaxID=1433147 RepID=A0A6N8FWB1_9CHRO|nr:response regulator [Gloeocapsopsis dulcis]MUL37054.1 two-component system response regulator [Gloeocapsopsis dulcis AAB1 = 1H9]WNN87908.1 response regulator [Gloeocapsopsis dulcis]